MGIISKKLSREVKYRLRNYERHVTEINEERESILYGTPRPSVGRHNGCPGDSTAVRGMALAKLEHSRLYRWAECITDAMEDWRQRGKREYLMLIKLRFFDRLPAAACWRRMHIERATFFNWQREVITFIGALALERGLWEEEQEEE